MRQLKYIDYSEIVQKAGNMYTAERKIVNAKRIKEIMDRVIAYNDVIEKIYQELGIKNKRYANAY